MNKLLLLFFYKL